MRSISIQEFEQDPAACIAEAEAGQRLVLLRGGKAVVEITPGSGLINESDQTQLWHSEEERLAAGAELMDILRVGCNLGGPTITTRDELYVRDSKPEATRNQLLALMDQGFDLGGKPSTYEERHSF